MKNFTTTQAGKVCNKSSEEMERLFDEDEIRGFLDPKELTKLIPVANLIRFMRINKIPLDSLKDDPDARALLCPKELVH